MNESEAREVMENGLSGIDLDGKKVLVLTPDGTRSGPLPMIFRLFQEIVAPRVQKLDFLIALGTHMPLDEEAKHKLFGTSRDELQKKYGKTRIYNHHWEKPETFRKIGSISAAEMEQISEGLMGEEVPVALNKLVFDYDHIIIYGPVFPHEVAGFSGGHKYFFPGIAAAEIINFSHWLGALITNYRIIGKAMTPVRKVIEKAASMVDLPVTGVCSVIEGDTGLEGLFVGPVEEAWKKAAELSSETHIKWVEKPYKKIISIMPEMYDDLWVGAKGMYKMEPVVEDGGEVIIYAPHIKEVSYVHGHILDEIGYHVRDYFVKQWERFKEYPGGVLAHSTHVKGMGEYEDGVERPRINVTLATGIPRERCELINLGWMDPEKLDLSEYEGREEEGILVVPRAGEILYRLASQREDF